MDEAEARLKEKDHLFRSGLIQKVKNLWTEDPTSRHMTQSLLSCETRREFAAGFHRCINNRSLERNLMKRLHRRL
jgi:hypothetical protein